MPSIFEAGMKGSKLRDAKDPSKPVSPVNSDQFRAAGLPVPKCDNHVVHAPNQDNS